MTAGDVAGSRRGGQRGTCGMYPGGLGVRKVARRVTVAVRVPEVSRGVAQGTDLTWTWVFQGRTARPAGISSRALVWLRAGEQANAGLLLFSQTLAGGSVLRRKQWRMMAVLG